MIFDTAATISGVRPGARAASAAPSASSPSSQLRKSPTVKWLTGAKAAASWLSMISRVTSSLSYAITASLRNCLSGTSARHICAATRSASLPAATPTSRSPERAGLALAISSRRSSKRQVVPPTSCE